MCPLAQSVRRVSPIPARANADTVVRRDWALALLEDWPRLGAALSDLARAEVLFRQAGAGTDVEMVRDVLGLMADDPRDGATTRGS